jgi:hypothetical protein
MEMETEAVWIKHREINYADTNIKQIHVDTRDFHCLVDTEDMDIPLPDYVHNSDGRYFYTIQEIKVLIEKLFIESGGDLPYRVLCFVKNTCGWELKYLRFYKSEKGFVVCTRENKFKDKDFWNNEINRERLHGKTDFLKCKPF